MPLAGTVTGSTVPNDTTALPGGRGRSRSFESEREGESPTLVGVSLLSVRAIP
jgi:hypothetical protein